MTISDDRNKNESDMDKYIMRKIYKSWADKILFFPVILGFDKKVLNPCERATWFRIWIKTLTKFFIPWGNYNTEQCGGN